MANDPLSTFGGLLRSCISDRYDTTDSPNMKEGLIVMLLGVGASFLTTYALSALGVFV